jgi:hypothetical protein
MSPALAVGKPVLPFVLTELAAMLIPEDLYKVLYTGANIRPLK